MLPNGAVSLRSSTKSSTLLRYRPSSFCFSSWMVSLCDAPCSSPRLWTDQSLDRTRTKHLWSTPSHRDGTLVVYCMQGNSSIRSKQDVCPSSSPIGLFPLSGSKSIRAMSKPEGRPRLTCYLHARTRVMCECAGAKPTHLYPVPRVDINSAVILHILSCVHAYTAQHRPGI